MTHHTETHFSPYTPYQLYKLVMDIEHYPEFLPWCKSAKIVKKQKDGLVADLTINFKAFTETFTSKVTLSPPGQAPASTAGHISVELVEGPFHHLVNRWDFTPEDGGTSITFTIDFEFRSKLLDKMIGFMFEAAMKKMVRAFEARAEALYGNKG